MSLARPYKRLRLLGPVRPIILTHTPLLHRHYADDQPPSNPLLDKVLAEKKKRTASKSGAGQTHPKTGSLAASSIFETREAASAPSLHAAGAVAVATETESAASKKYRPDDGRAQALAAKLDPRPALRRRWERKMVIRDVQKRGRLTKAQLIQRTERASLAKSAFWKTSTKKLGMLARQIQGKSLDEALTQMRFSKKRVAQQVRQHLQEAYDEAVVRKGMNLGAAEGRKGEPVTVRLKDGTKHRVEDRTSVYVDEAWVGRGSYGKAMDYRARGRGNVMRLPQTSLTVVLKEEATRIRQHDQREEKKANRKTWVPLPDRPIPGQRPYYSW